MKSDKLLTRRHLLHVIVVRLHAHKGDVVIFTTESTGLVEVRALPFNRKKPRMLPSLGYSGLAKQLTAALNPKCVMSAEVNPGQCLTDNILHPTSLRKVSMLPF